MLLGIAMDRRIKITNTKGFECKDSQGYIRDINDIEYVEILIKQQTTGLFYVYVTVHALDSGFSDINRGFVADYTDAKKIQEAPRSFMKSISKIFMDEDINNPEF